MLCMQDMVLPKTFLPICSPPEAGIDNSTLSWTASNVIQQVIKNIVLLACPNELLENNLTAQKIQCLQDKAQYIILIDD